MSNEIIKFLIKAKKATYAGEGAEIAPSRPNSHDLMYEENDLKYIDTYLGGLQFAGEEALWRSDMPLWTMNYLGRVLSDEFPAHFHKEALLLVPEDMPYRGPAKYKKGDYTYTCTVDGDFKWFTGYEEIHDKDIKVYECHFHGGIIM